MYLYDSIIQSSENLVLVEDKERDFFMCMPSDFRLAQEIAKVTNSAELKDNQFAFFNLDLSDNDKFNLQEFSECLDFAALDVIGNLHMLYSKTSGLIQFLCPNISFEIIHSIANLITKLASLIVANSGYTDAEIILKTYGHDDNWFLDRHIDKTHYEMSNKEKNHIRINDYQYIYLLPLIGKSTLFFPLSAEKKITFNEFSHETFVTRGEAFSSNKASITALFNSSVAYSTPAGYGSIHIAGKNGTIHSKPDTFLGRFIVTVIPNDNLSLSSFNDFIKKSLFSIPN